MVQALTHPDHLACQIRLHQRVRQGHFRAGLREMRGDLVSGSLEETSLKSTSGGRQLVRLVALASKLKSETTSFFPRVNSRG